MVQYINHGFRGSEVDGWNCRTEAVFPFDDLLIGLDILLDRSTVAWEDPANYRWNDYRNHIRALRAGEAVTLDAKSPTSEEAGIETRLIDPRPIVVVAGFLALHDGKVNGLFDTTVFIDLPEDEMQARRRVRANPANPWDTEAYIADGLVTGTREHVAPQRDIAEYVLDGMKSQEELSEEVLDIMGKARPR